MLFNNIMRLVINVVQHAHQEKDRVYPKTILINIANRTNAIIASVPCTAIGIRPQLLFVARQLDTPCHFSP